MTADELRRYLTQRRVDFKESEVQHGTQFRCTSGEIFNVFQTGRFSPQGKRGTDLANAVEAWDKSGSMPAAGAVTVSATESTVASSSVGPDRRIFVVYGHDTGARETLELLLHRMKLEPIVLANLSAGGDTIIEKLERYLGEHDNVGFACVLLTPDDEGHVAGQEQEKKYRARQNPRWTPENRPLIDTSKPAIKSGGRDHWMFTSKQPLHASRF